jgi:hypothetical protein
LPGDTGGVNFDEHGADVSILAAHSSKWASRVGVFTATVPPWFPAGSMSHLAFEHGVPPNSYSLFTRALVATLQDCCKTSTPLGYSRFGATAAELCDALYCEAQLQALRRKSAYFVHGSLRHQVFGGRAYVFESPAHCRPVASWPGFGGDTRKDAHEAIHYGPRDQTGVTWFVAYSQNSPVAVFEVGASSLHITQIVRKYAVPTYVPSQQDRWAIRPLLPLTPQMFSATTHCSWMKILLEERFPFKLKLGIDQIFDVEPKTDLEQQLVVLEFPALGPAHCIVALRRTTDRRELYCGTVVSTIPRETANTIEAACWYAHKFQALRKICCRYRRANTLSMETKCDVRDGMAQLIVSQRPTLVKKLTMVVFHPDFSVSVHNLPINPTNICVQLSYPDRPSATELSSFKPSTEWQPLHIQNVKPSTEWQPLHMHQVALKFLPTRIFILGSCQDPRWVDWSWLEQNGVVCGASELVRGDEKGPSSELDFLVSCCVEVPPPEQKTQAT